MESKIKVHCECGKTGLVDRKHIGKTITCPKCGIARIKVEDPEASLPKNDESGTIDIVDVPPANKKTEIPPAPLISMGELFAEVFAEGFGRVPSRILGRVFATGRHWQLTAICGLLAIIAGIMVYNQYDGWRREKNAKESAERKKEWEHQLTLMHRRNEVDREFNERTDDVVVVNVSANDFFAFLEEQPDDYDFAINFMLYQRSPNKHDNCFSPREVEYMLDRSDLFLRWAMTNWTAPLSAVSREPD